MRPLLPATEFFTRMFTREALASAEAFLRFEELTLKKTLDDFPVIKNLVVIGSGPLAYRYLISRKSRQLFYVGIDPYYQVAGEMAPHTFLIDQLFEDVQRSGWRRGASLYVFWFNVLFYITDPVFHLNRLLRPGDIVFNSGWSTKPSALPVMEDYFSHVYHDATQLVQPIIKQITTHQPRLKNQLRCCPTVQHFSNGINNVELLFS
jgi:hypothetical protein